MQMLGWSCEGGEALTRKARVQILGYTCLCRDAGVTTHWWRCWRGDARMDIHGWSCLAWECLGGDGLIPGQWVGEKFYYHSSRSESDRYGLLVKLFGRTFAGISMMMTTMMPLRVFLGDLRGFRVWDLRSSASESHRIRVGLLWESRPFRRSRVLRDMFSLCVSCKIHGSRFPPLFLL